MAPSLVRNQKELVQCGHFGTRGVLQMRMSALLGAKNYRFFEIYGVSVQKKGLSLCGKFAKSGGQFFAILCGRRLWTVSKTFILP